MRRHLKFVLPAILSAGLGFAQTQEKQPSRLRSMHLKGETAQVLRQALDLYGVDVIFVEPIQGLSRPLKVDLADADLAVTAEVLSAMSRCFFVPVNAHLVLAVQDDKTHRSEYERLFTETIVIPNMQPGNPEQRSEVEGLLGSVFGITRSTLKEDRVTIRATKRDLVQVEDTLTHLFEPPPQVLLEVRAYMVSRNYDRNTGVDPPQQITIFNVESEAESLIAGNASIVKELIAEGLASAGDYLGIALALIEAGYGSSSVLSSPFVTVGGGLTDFGVQFGSVAANLSLTESTSQQLQTVTLRLANGEAGKLRIGSRYPVLTASTVAAGGSASSATPSIEYEDLGLTLEAKPQVVSEGEILLQLHETIRALAGSSLNGIPVLENQEFVSALSVPSGATTVVVSDLGNTETQTVEGLGTIAPTARELNQQSSALVVTVTPHLVRARSREAVVSNR
jgi:general secretion pathway protein D